MPVTDRRCGKSARRTVEGRLTFQVKYEFMTSHFDDEVIAPAAGRFAGFFIPAADPSDARTSSHSERQRSALFEQRDTSMKPETAHRIAEPKARVY